MPTWEGYNRKQRFFKNDRNGGIWQSRISKSLAEYVKRPVCLVNVQSSLHENVVFSDHASSFFRSSSFLRSSSFVRASSFVRSSSFLRLSSFLRSSSF